MGDFAQDALWNAIEEEMWCDDNVGGYDEDGNSAREAHESFRSGFPTVDNIDKEMMYLTSLLNGGTPKWAETNYQVGVVKLTLDSTKQRKVPKDAVKVKTPHGVCYAVPVKLDTKLSPTGRIPKLPIWKRAENKANSYAFVVSLAEYYAEHKYLSDKQKNILSTNYIGGVESMIKDVEKFGIKEFRKIFEEASDHMHKLALWTYEAGLDKPLYEFY